MLAPLLLKPGKGPLTAGEFLAHKLVRNPLELGMPESSCMHRKLNRVEFPFGNLHQPVGGATIDVAAGFGNEKLQDPVDDHSAPLAVIAAAQGVLLPQAEDMLCIDFVGVGDQRPDRRHRQSRRSGPGGRAGLGARFRLKPLLRQFHEPDPAEKLLPPCPHRRQRFTAVRPEAGQEASKTAQPSRGDGRGVCGSGAPAQHHLPGGDRLLEVMGAQPGFPFRQEKAGLPAHVPVEPGIRHRLGGPCSVVQAAGDDQVGALHPRIDGVPDGNERVGGEFLPNQPPGGDRPEEVGVVGAAHRAGRIAFRLQFREGGESLPAGHRLPGNPAILPLRAPPEMPGQPLMQFRESRQACGGNLRESAQGFLQPFDPSAFLWVRTEFVVKRIDNGRQAGPHIPVPESSLQDAGHPQMEIAAPSGMGHRVLQEGHQGNRVRQVAEHVGDGMQEPPWCRMQQDFARTVEGRDAPALQRGGDPSCEFPVGRDQRGPFSVLNRLAQAKRDGDRLLPWVGRLQQRQPFGCLPDAAQGRTLGHPLIGNGRRTKRQGYETVPGADLPGLPVPGRNAVGADVEIVHQAFEPVLRMILAGG